MGAFLVHSRAQHNSTYEGMIDLTSGDSPTRPKLGPVFNSSAKLPPDEEEIEGVAQGQPRKLPDVIGEHFRPAAWSGSTLIIASPIASSEDESTEPMEVPEESLGVAEPEQSSDVVQPAEEAATVTAERSPCIEGPGSAGSPAVPSFRTELPSCTSRASDTATSAVQGAFIAVQGAAQKAAQKEAPRETGDRLAEPSARNLAGRAGSGPATVSDRPSGSLPQPKPASGASRAKPRQGGCANLAQSEAVQMLSRMRQIAAGVQTPLSVSGQARGDVLEWRRVAWQRLAASAPVIASSESCPPTHSTLGGISTPQGAPPPAAAGPASDPPQPSGSAAAGGQPLPRSSAGQHGYPAVALAGMSGSFLSAPRRLLGFSAGAKRRAPGELCEASRSPEPAHASATLSFAVRPCFLLSLQNDGHAQSMLSHVKIGTFMRLWCCLEVANPGLSDHVPLAGCSRCAWQ